MRNLFPEPASRIPSRLRSDRRVGFTIIEILLVIALIGTLLTLVAINIGTILDGGVSKDGPEDMMRDAVREARFIAGEQKRAVSLRYDSESRRLLVEDAMSESELMDFAMLVEEETTVTFFVWPAQQGFPQSRYEPSLRDRLEVPSVQFSPDQGGSRFEVEIDFGQGDVSRMRFDAFSHLQIDTEDLS